MADVTSDQIEALLREAGLIPRNYSGTVEVTASTNEGDETIKIHV
jgi:hypothetical protein